MSHNLCLPLTANLIRLRKRTHVRHDIPSYRHLTNIRDRVIELCSASSDCRILDVGCGDGLIGRALLETLGPNGSVTFLDINPDSVRELAVTLASDSRVHTVVDDVQELAQISSSSVDLVVIRAVLLYVPRKDLALVAAHRVLVEGGRLVLAEPINRHLYYPAEQLWGFDLSDIPTIAQKLQRGFTEARELAVRAMMDWDDIDLAKAVVDSGFTHVKVETVTEIVSVPTLPWLAFIHARWTPWLPNLAGVMSEFLTREEALTFERVAKPQLASGMQQIPLRNTFVTARAERADTFVRAPS